MSMDFRQSSHEPFGGKFQNMHPMEHFLKSRLQVAGKSQDELGEALHRDKASISRLINGKQDLALRQLTPTAQFLGLSVADLLSGLDIDPGRPAIDKTLLADCLVAVLRRYQIGAEAADEMANMAATLYGHAVSDERFRSADSMAATATVLADFAAAQRK